MPTLCRRWPRTCTGTQAIRCIGTIIDLTEAKVLQERVQLAYDDLEVKVTFRNLELERAVQ